MIIVWWNNPKGLSNDYNILLAKTLNILIENKNEVFFVDILWKFENLKYGQVWCYENPLLRYPTKKSSF